jgi:hypothetical protein
MHQGKRKGKSKAGQTADKTYQIGKPILIPKIFLKRTNTILFTFIWQKNKTIVFSQLLKVVFSLSGGTELLENNLRD